MFKFSGSAVLSKSWLNRAQVIKYFNPEVIIKDLEIMFSEDVKSMQEAIAQIRLSKKFDLGQGGTSLRFFSFLISREPGNWSLAAHSRLLERPQAPIRDLLTQLNVDCLIEKDGIKIVSNGWKINKPIYCSGDISSQFVSGLILSSWNLPQDLEIVVQKPIVSREYLNMTIKLLQAAGMQVFLKEDNENLLIKINKNQKATATLNLIPEPDVSSIFSLSAAAVVAGEISVTNWSSQSTQPDIYFLELFKKMGIKFEIQNTILKVSKQTIWNAVETNLQSSPDLFPVLAALCALAKGVSILNGAAHLKLKESNRIKKTKELLEICGFQCEELIDGLKIVGQSSTIVKDDLIIFDPDYDHRMAMAAAIFKLAGFNIEIKNTEVVNKSYPSFWKDIGL